MLEKYYFNQYNHTDLNVYRCGMEDCKPGHFWGPALRDHYIIHYISGGKGIYQVNGVTYNLVKGDGFLICPYTIVYYKADLEDPWSYAWVGFHGLKAESCLNQAVLTANNPIFRYNKDDFLLDCFSQMIEAMHLTRGRESRLIGLLYILLSQLMESANSVNRQSKGENFKEEYIKKSIEYISMNYSRKISIKEIASHVGLDRSYLYSLFKEYLSSSPQDFLINFRINKACDLMGNSSLSIGDIARSVGYEDPLLFSKVFKKVKNAPPREYRRGV
ncbi:MAG TPA: AraC family transcriptional regulator [Clostridiales bacterium]|nr:AraC family transcriptional regulator [Clostridiales bacterium]